MSYLNYSTMTKITSLLFTGFLFLTILNASAFTDDDTIPDWSRDAIDVLVETGIINGNADGSFAPLESVNRAAFCKILVLATETALENPEVASFPDVLSDAWYYSYVETAKAKGWIDGYPDGDFRPAGAINRAEISKILVRAFDFDIQASYPTDQWYMPYLRSLNNKQLLAYGEDFLTLDAGVDATRAEVVEQIYRVLLQTGMISEEEESEEEDEMPRSTTYVAPVLAPLTSTLSPDSGDLTIKRNKGVNQKIYVYNKEKDVEVLHLQLSASNGPVKISEFQFRHIGSGKFSNFSQAWLELDGTVVSSKVLISGDLVKIKLYQDFTVPSTKSRELVLKVDLSGRAKKGDSSRFVLYLPEWIAADTATKIGFFPFGGEDLEIKN